MGSAHADGPFATEPLEPELLASGDWSAESPESYARRTADDRRWHHPGLDLYLHPSAPRRDLTVELMSSSPVVATNAAILVAHWGGANPVKHLAAAVRAEQLPRSLRCAAAEALGFVEKPSPAPTLRELLDALGPGATPQSPDGEEAQAAVREETPDLQADLIRALARHAEPGDEKWFDAALASRHWQVRLEGADAWRALPDLSLPGEFIALVKDGDPRVRAIAVRTIAAHRDPRGATQLREALRDPDPDVRLAAIAALDPQGAESAEALVADIRDQGAEIQQAAFDAAREFRKLHGDTQAAATEARSELGQAVAETLEGARARGDELAGETLSAAQQAAGQTGAQLGQVAEAGTRRFGEARQLVAALREEDLGEAARRQAAGALERMARDADVAVRVEAARAMGELADPAFLPALMELLNDVAEVQTAAMASLEAIAGSDAPGAAGGPLGHEEKARLWQLWYRDRQNRTPGA